jgi:uncharacterized membrane protein
VSKSKTADGAQSVEDYLRELATTARILPAARRKELIEDVRSHIEVALAEGGQSPAAVLGGLGEPREIVASALAEGAGSVQLSKGITGLEVTAILLLLFGAVLVGVGWLVGVLLLWASPRWTLADKLLGALILPWGLFMPVDLALQNPQFWHGAGSSAALVVAMAAPIFSAVWLTFRARRMTVVNGTYRWGTGVLALGVALLAIPVTAMLVLAAA